MIIKVNEKIKDNCDTVILAYLDTLEGLFEGVDEDVLNSIDYLIKSKQFKGEYKEIKVITLYLDNNLKNIILLGLGDKETLTGQRVRGAVARAVKECEKLCSKNIQFILDNMSDDFVKKYINYICEGIILSVYKFEKYKTSKRETNIDSICINCKVNKEEINHLVNEANILASATNLCRDLVNEPANKLTPIDLANKVVEIGKESNFLVEIYDEKQIENLGMKAYLEVAKGASNPPRLIVMKYMKDIENKDNILGLVGKGLTYDSGGLSLKMTDSMVEMKSDMAGAGAVIGTISAIAKMNLKVNVIGVIAACENMISSNAYKPGDIIESMAGKTIEVLNTDAEGRLTLVDAVNYVIEKENVSKVLDIATLTGAALVALGTITTAVVSNNDNFYLQLEKASKISGEKIWRLPNYPEYKELIKSDIADLKNTGGKYAGTITAAVFIEEFVKDRPWIHMDIAGTSWSEKEFDYIPKGATGEGVMTLYHLIKNS
ncbi:leucyl aminopeptidase [Alkalithermobacter thermoalcaliphilus]|uniref:leucyl aminopeptidase n=2 Tax=Clostridium paradoxum TaxID=29346 RepID=UPI00093093AE